MSTELTRVAVYGSLRNGMGNNRLLVHPEVEMVGVDIVEDWALYPYAGYGFPAVGAKQGAVTTVEVYDVPQKVMARLDSLEGYPSFYDRVQVPVMGDTKAWMYIHHEISPELEAKHIEHGDWVKYHRDAQACGC